jgi:DNA replication protein DnaC
LSGKNLIFFGGTGTGKTHLSIAIIVGQIKNGKKGKFYSLVNLENTLEQEKQNGKSGRLLERLSRQYLVVVDELGTCLTQKMGLYCYSNSFPRCMKELLSLLQLI